ncbi:hypothetical protein ACEXQE_10310 [Herbiconiux sp. P17]|uniref:hypothetical protein n=1 Tax=Herbiconiux wuyangfengii TaxID=3342794 RepID=UPI0035BA1CF9
MQFVAREPMPQVTVIAHHNGRIDALLQHIDQQMRGDIDIAPFSSRRAIGTMNLASGCGAPAPS